MNFASKILKKSAFLLAATVLCASFSAPVRADAFTPEQKKELEVLFRDYIRNNPEVILDSVQAHQIKEEERRQKGAEANLKEYKDKLTKGQDLPFAGNPEGDVTIVEFFDYNCGYCKKAFEDVTKILAEDPNVKVVFIDMPILSEQSRIMSKLGMAAQSQGKYFEAHKALMEYRGTQSEENFLNAMKDAGIDIEKVKAEKDSPEIDAALNRYVKIANDLNIRGTPGFIVGDTLMPGYVGHEAMKKEIDAARQAAKTP